MASANVLNWKKDKVGTVDLDDAVFGVEVKKEILHEVIRWQLASRRQGTAMTKTRAFVSGGGKKPFKQKGTGNARQGSSRSPLMPGGAKLFGPTPRDYSYALPKKIRKLGLRMALSQLLKDGKLFVIEGLESKDGKTKGVTKHLKQFGIEKGFLIGAEVDDLFARSTRNLAKVKYGSVEALNVYDLLRLENAVISKSAVAKITERLGGE